MLSAQSLSCIRGGRPLFSGVELQLERGQWARVRGANGAGKTSLLRILAGLACAERGEVHWRGQNIAASEAWRRELLFLGHLAALKDELTPLENLQAAGALDGTHPSEDASLRALRRFGLAGREDLPVRFLSAGQRRRVLLSRTLVRPAAAWILDEPFTALDTAAVGVLTEVLQKHLGSGGIAVVTSHQDVPLAGGVEVTL